MEIDLKQLKELMRSLKQFDVTELEIEADGARYRLVRQGAEAAAPAHMGGTNVHITPHMGGPVPVQTIPVAPPMPSVTTASSEGSAAAAVEDDPSMHFITSPFVGTFYAAPSPDAQAFVKVGSHIQPGQPLCIVEAMKLMNEIEADVAGEIVEVLAVNGKSVEYGDRLFKVKKA